MIARLGGAGTVFALQGIDPKLPYRDDPGSGAAKVWTQNTR